MMQAIFLLLLAYVLGSVSGSLLLGKLRGVDIRTVGSGNAGGTNALRTQGVAFALATVLVDAGKGALAAWLALRFLPEGAKPAWLFACVIAAAVGHVWPIFHGFRGGKGAATLVGGLAVVWPQTLLPAFVVWLLSLMWGGYVGLATVLAGVTVLVFALFAGADGPHTLLAAIIALFLLFTHRSNLRRLRNGTEPCFERARLLGRLLDRSR